MRRCGRFTTCRTENICSRMRNMRFRIRNTRRRMSNMCWWILNICRRTSNISCRIVNMTGRMLNIGWRMSFTSRSMRWLTSRNPVLHRESSLIRGKNQFLGWKKRFLRCQRASLWGVRQRRRMTLYLKAFVDLNLPIKNEWVEDSINIFWRSIKKTPLLFKEGWRARATGWFSRMMNAEWWMMNEPLYNGSSIHHSSFLIHHFPTTPP